MAQTKREKKDKYLRKTYGISVDEWESLWTTQGSTCAICGAKPKIPVVDHNHTLGNVREAVRGLLCKICNRALAHVKEDAEFAQAVANYLADPPAQYTL